MASMRVRTKIRTRDLILAGLFAALTAVGAFLKFPLGTMAVTLQFFFTAMAGVLLGPGLGALSQAVYVALGLVGLPVFTMGGGPGYVFQPSFGFLLGLIPAAWVTGVLADGGRRPVRTALACTAGLAALYLVGLPYMALVLNGFLGKALPLSVLFETGLLVYLPGDALKICATAAITPVLARTLARAQ